MSWKKTFAALADDNRQKILEALRECELNAGQIGSKLTISGPSISHHLGVLKQANLVSSRRQGQEIIYSLNVSVLEELSQAMIKFLKIKKNNYRE
jgi:DNA-binding transcriptional ArsR family regulator